MLQDIIEQQQQVPDLACGGGVRDIHESHVNPVLSHALQTPNHMSLRSCRPSLLRSLPDIQNPFYCPQYKYWQPVSPLPINTRATTEKAEQKRKYIHAPHVLAMLISRIAKTLNRKSTGYGLLLTTICCDGGRREDSMKFKYFFPGTSTIRVLV